MKKALLLVIFLVSTFIIQAQEKVVYAVGDDVEYFDGVNWIDSKIVQVGANNQYLIYLNQNQAKTKWLDGEELQPLYKAEQKIIERKVVITEYTVVPKFFPGDLIKYKSNGTWIETEIIQRGADLKYQVYSDASKNSILWINEADIELIKSKTQQTSESSEFKVGDKVKVYDGGAWLESEIVQVGDSGMYQVYFNSEKTESRWVQATDLKK
ncbi:MAG: hypothetical protein V4622_10675 [Bacteroidota bacterium]